MRATKDHSVHAGSDLTMLSEVATLQLYRENAFRVLGLTVGADSAQICRQQNRMKLREKLGGASTSDELGVLPIDPLPDFETVRKASQRLQDMQFRLVDELFWVWPLSENTVGDDDGIALLQRADIQGAHRVWAAVSSNSPEWGVASHNLAVLHHALALDVEVAEQWQGRPPKSRAIELGQHWRLALSNWAVTVDNDAVWSRLTSRARAMDDPRLSAEFVCRLRQSLPKTILGINVRYAGRAVRRGDSEEARRHATYVRESGFDPEVADKLWDDEIGPLADQMKRLCEPIWELCKASPTNADQLAERALRDCHPLLEGISAILGEDHHVRQAACDLVARTVRSCAIDFGNATEDWDRCVPLLERAGDLAIEEGLLRRICDDLDQVEKARAHQKRVLELAQAVTGNRVYEVTVNQGDTHIPNTCPCCLGMPTGEQTVSHTWEETHGATRYQRSLSVTLPICDACRQHQRDYSAKRFLLVLLSAGLSTATSFLVVRGLQQPEWLHFALAGSVLTVAVALALSAVIRLRPLPEQHACRDQSVEMLKPSDSHVVLRFHNPLYAEAFADSNSTTVRERQMTKPPRGTYILAGRGAMLSIFVAVILAAIAQSLIYAASHDDWKQGRSTPAQPFGSPSSRPYSQPPARSFTYSATGLWSRIDSGKERVRGLESEIAKIDQQMEMLASTLSRYKREVADYESRVGRGLWVNQDLYQQTIDYHNRLVGRYNSLLEHRQLKCDAYQRALNSVNDMVARYNRGER